MEELIGLLLAAAILVFKYVGKRLEQSGSSGKARKVREFADALDGEDSPMHDWEYLGKALFGEKDMESVNVPEKVVAAEVNPLPAPAQAKPVKSRKHLLNEVVPKEKKDRIDPKKLVVYSEIMKPKFKE